MKNISLLKRIIALAIILVMNINTYATVSNNDGTQFVTKAEYDAMMNNFNNQMANYQAGLNSKIDDAISSYLGGLSAEQVVKQVSLINSASMPFTRDWKIWGDGEKSELGDKFMYSLFIIASATEMWQSRVTGSKSGHTFFEWKVGTDDAGGARFRTIGSKNSKYVVYSKSDWNDSYKVLNSTMNSYMVSSYTGLFLTGANTYWRNDNVGSVNQDVVVDTAEEWRSTSENKSGTVFGVSVSPKGIKSFSNVDSTSVPVGIYVTSGNSVPDSDKVYAVLNTEINKKMTTYRSGSLGACNASYFRAQWDDGGDSWSGTDNTLAAKYKIAGYDHKYTEIPSGTGYKEFIIDSVSLLTNTDVHYYSGLPLFTATDNGTVEMKLTFTNTTNDTSNWQIKEGKFTENGPITVGLGSLSNGYTEYVDDAGNVIKNVYVIPAGKTQTIKFDCNKGKTYWIKIEPSTGLTAVESTSIVITK